MSTGVIGHWPAAGQIAVCLSLLPDPATAIFACGPQYSFTSYYWLTSMSCPADIVTLGAVTGSYTCASTDPNARHFLRSDACTNDAATLAARVGISFSCDPSSRGPDCEESLFALSWDQ